MPLTKYCAWLIEMVTIHSSLCPFTDTMSTHRHHVPSQTPCPLTVAWFALSVAIGNRQQWLTVTIDSNNHLQLPGQLANTAHSIAHSQSPCPLTIPAHRLLLTKYRKHLVVTIDSNNSQLHPLTITTSDHRHLVHSQSSCPLQSPCL